MKELCRNLYKDQAGQPVKLTDGQALIFSLIFQKRFRRNHIMTYTQYGKSFCVALGILTRVTTHPEKWCIVAGREKQAKIIMGYIIDHVMDNEYTRNRLIMDTSESFDKIKHEKSKNRLTFKHGNGLMGEVFVLSADARNKQTAGDSVMGFGAPNVVLDEAALIDDDIEAKIFRMLGAQPDNFYFKIGNPFRNNHFKADHEDKAFFHFNVDYIQGLQEGRLTREFIEEARKKPLFDVLYENKFPKKDLQDGSGFLPLLEKSDLKTAEELRFIGRKRMGIDPAGQGSDQAKWVIRDNFKMRVVATEDESDPKSGCERTMTLMEEFGLTADEVDIDGFGEGSKWAAALAKEGIAVNVHNVGDPCDLEEDKKQFINLRAMASWRLKDWIKAGGKIDDDPNWKELTKVKWKVGAGRRIQIMSKEDMKNKERMESPNTFDAAMLTFVEVSDLKKDEGADDINIEYGADGRPKEIIDSNPLGL